MSDTEKIFCIGFHKTGTTSVREALILLGYKYCFWRKLDWNPEPGDVPEALLRQMSEYEAFADGGCWYPGWFKRIDEEFKNSKFILTVRDEDEWFKSMIRFFGIGRQNMFPEIWNWIYGRDRIQLENKKDFLEAYRKHNNNVMSYFANSNNLLVINLADGNDNWIKICNFLKRNVPELRFPHANKS